MLRKSKIAVSVASALLMTACGGGGSSSSSSGGGSTDSLTQVSGRAADGYLVDARVCADLNDNGRCDSGEPVTSTTAGGFFELELTSSELKSNLVVEAIANLTVDEDTMQPVPAGFTLRSPIIQSNDTQFVSPVTTMVTNELAKSPGTTLEQAKAVVAQRLQTSFDVTEDYVAAKESGDEAAVRNAERLHRIAQVTARIQAEIESQVDQSDLDQVGMTKKELLDMISRQVEILVGQILTDVDSTLDQENFDPDSILQQPEYDVAIPEPSPPTGADTLAERIAAAGPANPFFEETSGGTFADIGAELNDLQIMESSSAPGKLYAFNLKHQLLEGEGSSGQIIQTEYASYDQGENIGFEYIPPDIDRVKVWTAEGLQEASITSSYIEAQNVTAQSASIATVDVNNVMPTEASFVRIDLGGLPTKDTIRAMYPNISAEVLAEVQDATVFPDYSYAYVRSETLANDLYLTSWHGTWDDSFYCWDGVTQAEAGSCNLVFGASNNGEHETPATTFDDLTYDYGQRLQGALTGFIGFEHAGVTYGMALRGDKSDLNGELHLVDMSQDATMEDDYTIIARGYWELKTTPFEHIELSLPDGIYYGAFQDAVGGDGYAFLHEVDGFVRAGRFTPAGTDVGTYYNRGPAGYELNDVAMQHVQQKLTDWSLLVAHPGWSGD